MKCIDCDSCQKGYFSSKPEQYVCIGVKHPFLIEDVNQECTEYPKLKERQKFEFNIPKTQTLWVTYLTDGKPTYIVTANSMRTQYTLWKVKNNGDTIKVETAKEPIFKTKL